MRSGDSTLRFSMCLALVTVMACGGGETAQKTDTAAPPPPPPPESFALVGDDGSWSVDITPAGITWRGKRGARSDSITFEFKEPTIDGAIYQYEVLRAAEDTNRISITMSKVPCKDKAGKDYDYRVQLWITGKRAFSGSGCGTKTG